MGITQKDIALLQPGKHSLGDSLYVRISATGRGSYILRLSQNGKVKDIGIGSTSSVSLIQAKKIARELKAKSARGEKVLGKRNINAPTTPTFNDLWPAAVAHYKEIKRWKNPRTYEQWKSCMRLYAAPVIGKKQLRDITRKDIEDIIKPLWLNRTETARKLRSRLEALFDWWIFNGLVDKNPAVWKANLSELLPPVEKVHTVTHRSAYPWQKLPQLVQYMSMTDSIGYKAVIFGTLTAARAAEFVPAKWIEVDFKNKVWSVPPERRKDSKPYPHRVPLSDQSIELLKSIPRNGEYIFSILPFRPISKETPRVLIQKLTGEKFTMHGMRSAFRDWAAEMGEDWLAAEKALSHAVGSAVTLAYQRSDLLDKRRGLMQRWADFLLPAEHT